MKNSLILAGLSLWLALASGCVHNGYASYGASRRVVDAPHAPPLAKAATWPFAYTLDTVIAPGAIIYDVAQHPPEYWSFAFSQTLGARGDVSVAAFPFMPVVIAADFLALPFVAPRDVYHGLTK